MKRLVHLPGLLMILSWRYKLILLGAEIGECTVVSKVRTVGSLKNLKIGSHSFIGGPLQISLQERVSIGSYVVINDGVRIISASHSLDDPRWTLTANPIEIADYCWIATAATILPGSIMEEGSVLGAAAVLKGTIPAYGVAIGNPAKQQVRRRTQNLKYTPNQGSAVLEAWLGPPWPKHDQRA